MPSSNSSPAGAMPRWLDDYLNQLHDGKFKCLHSVLLRAMRLALADSAYVVRQDGTDTSVRYWIDARQRGETWLPEFLEGFQAWLRENGPELQLWDTHEFLFPGGATGPPHWMLVIKLPLRDVVPNRVLTHYVCLLGSKWLGPRVYWPGLHPFAECVVVLLSVWFTWLYSQREERQRNLQRLSESAIGAEGAERLVNTLQWPAPFQDVIDMLQVVWDFRPLADRTEEQFRERWLEAVRRRLCATEAIRQETCHLGGCFLCCAAEDRAHFDELSNYLEWRFVPSADDGVFEEPSSRPSPFALSRTGPALERKSLAGFFADNFWRDWFQAPGRALALGPRERRRCLSSCAHLVHYIVGELPIDEETIEALVWSVSRYGHDHLGIEPRLDLSTHLFQAARLEPALHVLRPYYRDHFLHAIEVCFLGHYLLVAQPDHARSLLDQCAAYLRMTPREVLAEWYVAALLHDIGYSIEVLAGTKRMLGFYGQSRELTALSEGIERQVANLSAALAGELPGFNAADKPGEDHGAVGAAYLGSLIENIQIQKKGANPYSAARYAISVHSHRRKEVHFHEHPLAFLLILCDTIQQWNRAHLRYSTSPETMLAKLLRGGRVEDLTGPLDDVRVEWRGAELKLRLSYGDEINQNAGVFRLWLDSTSNLQRLQSDGLDFNVSLEFATPVFRKAGAGTSQMDRLKDAAEELRMNFLADWFPNRSAGAVDHRLEGSREVLTLDLRKLGGRRLITDSMSAFWTRLAQWSRFSEDRDFLDDVGPVPPS